MTTTITESMKNACVKMREVLDQFTDEEREDYLAVIELIERYPGPSSDAARQVIAEQIAAVDADIGYQLKYQEEACGGSDGNLEEIQRQLEKLTRDYGLADLVAAAPSA